MEMAGRGFSGSYRFGYQGSEKDNEVSGDGNSYTTEFRQLDPRLGRWFSVDPMEFKYAYITPYASMHNNPINITDVKGLGPDGDPVNLGGQEYERETLSGPAADDASKLDMKEITFGTGASAQKGLAHDNGDGTYTSFGVKDGKKTYYKLSPAKQKNLIIFVNGEVQTFGPIGKENNKDRGNESYWSPATNFVEGINNEVGGDVNNKFVDGDQGTWPSTRYNAGYAQAQKDAQSIIDNLHRNSKGEIDETIYIITHSKGSEFGNGYKDALQLEILRRMDISIVYSAETTPISLTLNLAPHQSDFVTTNEIFINQMNISITHEGDVLSDDDVFGSLNIKTDRKLNTSDSHKVKYFLREATYLLRTYKSLSDKYMYDAYIKAANK